MNTQLKSMTLAILLGLGSAATLAADPAADSPAAPPATEAPAAQPAPEPKAGSGEDGPKSFSMSIGADGAKITDDEGESHGITITVDADDDEEDARVQIAGKIVDRVVDDLERSLADLPEDVRRDLDADDMRELRKALREVRALKGEHAAPLADSGFDEDLIPGIVAITLLFGGPVVIVALVSYNNRRKRQMVHETIDRIIAQGKDVPVELLEALDKGEKSRNGKSMLARGVTNLALGIGIAGVLWGLGGDEAASLGLIWICYGLGQLVVWKLEGDTRPGRDATPVS
jgi:hypothetical protein